MTSSDDSPDGTTNDQPWVPPPWDPPLAGTEIEHVLGSLERLRVTFRWKTGGLDAAGLATTIGASRLTLGGLIKHLAGVEAMKAGPEIDGSSPGEPWGSAPWDEVQDWDFTSAGQDSPEQLYALYDAAVAQAQSRLEAALDRGGLDQRIALSDQVDLEVSLRRNLFDLIEEYSRHLGHADLIREAVDGQVGLDPPYPETS